MPQLCCVDDIGSFSTNEITANRDSALAWVSSFAADQGGEATDRGVAPAEDDSPSLWIAPLVAFTAAGGGVAYFLSRNLETGNGHPDSSSHEKDNPVR